MVKHYILARLISKLSIPSFKNCDMDKTAFADSRCIFNGVKMGRYSYANENTCITDADIGAFTSIGSSCQIGGGYTLQGMFQPRRFSGGMEIALEQILDIQRSKHRNAL